MCFILEIEVEKVKKEIKKGVSVIIPTFNRVKFLYPTLVCLCNQKIEETLEYEIIIIDSGDDETESVVRMFQRNGKISIIYKKIQKCTNRSLLRNTGANLSEYSILCFLDNDILVPPSFISTVFDVLEKNNNAALMFYRKSLLEFDISKIGVENIILNFSILDNLSWYDDVRRNVDISQNPWEYVYSHSLAMNKELFQKAGKFDERFGINWGFEDMDLGYRLFYQNCSFILDESTCVYHQPHFTQSNMEQNSGRANYELFLQLHNDYKVDLALSFYKDSIRHIKQIESLEKNNLCNSPKYDEFDLVLACIIKNDELNKSEKYRLGTTLPFSHDSKNKVLISKNFFLFDKEIQLCIFSEASRVAKFIYIESLENKTVKDIKQIGIDCGICMKIEWDRHFYKCEKKSLLKSSLYEWFIPSVGEPEKRGLFFWIINKSIEKSKKGIIRDTQNSESNQHNDFYVDISNKDITWSKTFYGVLNTEKCISYSVIQNEDLLTIPDNENTLVFHDEAFINTSNKHLAFSKAKELDKEEVADLNFLWAFDLCRQVEFENIQVDSEDYYCFMENGFYEDGIDLIINDFIKRFEKHTNKLLHIKIPNYKELYLDAYPLHNDESKIQKTYSIIQRHEWELFQLHEMIKKLKIEDQIIIHIENLSIEQIANLINNCEGVYHFSRGIYVPVEIYLAMLLDKKTCIGEHHIVPKELKSYFSVFNSRRTWLPQALRIPASSNNISYECFDIINSNSFEINHKTLNKQYINSVHNKKTLEAYKIVF